jgi:hypothetical protein
VRVTLGCELAEALPMVEESIGIYKHLVAQLPQAFTAQLDAACRTRTDVLDGLGRTPEPRRTSDSTPLPPAPD